MARDAFVDFVLDTLRPLGPVRGRAMFGGTGIYRDDTMFAIIAGGELYLKADSVTRALFEAEGLSAFTYVRRGKTVTLSYYKAPPAMLDDPEELARWTRLAQAAASRQRRTPAAARRKPGAKR